MNDEVQLIIGCEEAKWTPDKIYITSLFTWAWKTVHDTVDYYKSKYPDSDITLGGIYATLMPEHAAQTGVEIHKGLFKEAEDLVPYYELVEDWDASIIFSSRGCVNNCPFCAVPILEPEFTYKESISELIYPGHKRVVLWDNNFLASPHFKEILAEIREKKLLVDFNQGIDLRLIDKETAELIKSMRTYLIRVAFDGREEYPFVKRGIENLIEAGVRPKKILCYILYNYDDTPDDFLFRLKKCMEWEVAAYPMRYQPVEGEDALKKDSHISPNWTQEQLDLVVKARRIMGKRGAFIPHKYFKAKVVSKKADTIEKALEIWPVGWNMDPVLRRKYLSSIDIDED